jgi:hypothetical protein
MFQLLAFTIINCRLITTSDFSYFHCPVTPALNFIVYANIGPSPLQAILSLPKVQEILCRGGPNAASLLQDEVNKALRESAPETTGVRGNRRSHGSAMMPDFVQADGTTANGDSSEEDDEDELDDDDLDDDFDDKDDDKDDEPEDEGQDEVKIQFCFSLGLRKPKYPNNQVTSHTY